MIYRIGLLLFISIFFTGNVFLQTEKEVKVKVGKDKLYGSFLQVEDKKAPVVIIIPGSGATDRDGNSMMIQPKTYKLLAEGFAENGISSLRYDKLGIGKSQTKIEEKDMTFEDNVNQVIAWIDFLQKKKMENIILIGHSEGSLIGMLATQKRNISQFISISGTGRSIDKVLLEQISLQAPDFQEETEKILAELKAGNPVSDFSLELISLFRESVQPYLISWIKYDPKIEIGKLDIPTLIIHGSTDMQVSEEDAQSQKAGNPNAELKIIEGMNHILKEAPEDKDKNMMTYYNPNLPLHPEIVKIIVDFIR